MFLNLPLRKKQAIAIHSPQCIHKTIEEEALKVAIVNFVNSSNNLFKN